MELDIALSHIADIREQMERTRQFRGFRAAGSLGMAAAAVGAGAWQAWRIPDAANHPIEFVDLWVCVAVASIAVCAFEVFWRYRKSPSLLQSQLTPRAIEQFMPFVIVGGLLPWVLSEYAPASVWMLPGLWQLIFGLALLSVRRYFPGPIVFIAGFYLLCGFLNLDAAHPRFSPYCMAAPFGIGQAANALVLYWHLERGHGE